MPNGGEANRFRIERLERDVQHLEDRLEDYAAYKQAVDALRAEANELKQEFSGLRRALYTAALTVAGSAILFAATVAVAIAQ